MLVCNETNSTGFTLSVLLLSIDVDARNNTVGLGFSLNLGSNGYGLSSSLVANDRPDGCPPCFNCQLDVFSCGHFGECSNYDGQCKCPPGWAGIDCLTPQCDSLADGEKRRQREDGKQCECKEGWGGVNCNGALALISSEVLDDDDIQGNMTCYKGGETVFQNHQTCKVTNRKILDMLPDRPPEFQFWTAQVESFYCALDACKADIQRGGHHWSATFSCKTGSGCKFEEPGMNTLIETFFGDGYITLDCEGGECLHYSQVPGYIRPPKPDNSRFIALSSAGAGLIVITVFAVLWYAGRTRTGDFGRIRLPENETAKLMTDHVPASLHFSDISYTLGGRTILDSISGSVRPGQLMAIMGASGAGKSTFLDILARKRKRGLVGGRTLKVVGFVDQEDTLMSTLTVYETVLYSALLRLPREMSLEAKKFRTLETMNELGILGIKDSRIGDSGHRSISGGEKRRVSIACELVTSPSILFLDEPTSGLDAYNALSVIASLVSLARDYNRTVVFTIHQPRSNIVSLFDQLVVLAAGKLVYSGEAAKCHDYLASIGQPCPPGFNIADYFIDMTMQAGLESRSLDSPPTEPAVSDDDANLRDEERALNSVGNPPTELQTRASSAAALDALTPASYSGDAPLPPRLAALVEAFSTSELRRCCRWNEEAARTSEAELPDVAFENSLTRGRKRASWGTQFRILSGRANDIPGFQNRLGILYLTIDHFRILFMRERANGYYSSFTYFSSKILFDILPLRVVPLVFGGIVYGLVGLVPTVAEFWKFMLTLVLFNLTTASVILLLSIAFSSTSVASLSVVHGLLINRETVHPAFGWLHTISFFHAAFEALAVNELRYLQLREFKYGVEIDVPAATILSMFGLRAQSFWWPNISLLGIFFTVFTISSYLILHFYVKERR
ncbi:hypothetical protein B0H21DRAFT_725268 [Amylocystis lapponica]|nr:hypothetical protein B0H21DRAFT_725268 [Amylocystis lapponica]